MKRFSFLPSNVSMTRGASHPGWKTAVKSTGMAKTKEQRDVERRKRQLDKLPHCAALPDFQYPMEKTVLCDQHFQFPVYDDELDTASLYNLTPPDDFFVFWNVKDGVRTQLPPVPLIDHRFESVSSDGWCEHRKLAIGLLQKHLIMPDIIPFTPLSINMSVVFGNSSDRLTRENFWLTAHYGNFIELSHQQKPPVLHFEAQPDKYYCFLMVSPDYPQRVSPTSGFMLHYALCNISSAEMQGTAMVDYVPPLPTDGAGSSRVICLLFEQVSKIPDPQRVELDFNMRSLFRMDRALTSSGTPLSQMVSKHPATVVFFTTVWDIQVQEWYERNGLPEPNYVPTDLVDILAVNSLPREEFQLSSRTLPDGSRAKYGQLVKTPVGKTQHDRRALNHLLSSRTRLSKDGRIYVTPQ